MKLTQLLLCKTPFTPSYEHLVTGCSSTEFYNKLASDNATQTISAVLTPNVSFRPVRETDREIVFSLNIIGENALYIKPQDYNYVATYEQNPTSRRFWFIESYNVDNSGVYPTVTFYCSVDYYHSYCLDADIYDQIVVRDTQNKNSNNVQYIADEITLPHRETIYSSVNSRVLWVRCKISLIEYSKPSISFGSPLDGGLPDIYFPIAYIDPNGDVLNETLNVAVLGPHDKDTISIDERTIVEEKEDVASVYRQIYSSISELMNKLSSIAIVKEMSLTYVVPFEYSYYKDDFGGVISPESYTDINLIDVIVTGSTRLKSLFGISTKSTLTSTFNYVKTVEFNNFVYPINKYNPWYNVYPYNYYSIHIGGFSLVVTYPIEDVKIYMRFAGSSSTFNCDIEVNGKIIQSNISVPFQYPLPINTTQADVIDAQYGSTYRDLQYAINVARTANSVISSVRTAAIGVIGMVGGIASANPIAIGMGAAGATKGTIDTVSSIMEGVERGQVLNAQETTASTQYFPVSLADSVILGNYPFIIKHTVDEHFDSFCKDRILKFGQKVYKLENPFKMNHSVFDFKKCSECRVISKDIPAKANEVICSALMNGVYLWNYNYLNLIGNYIVNNPDLEV